MMIEVQLVYDDCPPSLNRIGTRGSRWVVVRAKARWQSILEDLLLVSALPRDQQRLHATASLRLPVQRTRDEGNYRWCLEKALGDALVNGRWLPDDSPEHFTFGELRFEAELGPQRTTITLADRA